MHGRPNQMQWYSPFVIPTKPLKFGNTWIDHGVYRIDMVDN